MELLTQPWEIYPKDPRQTSTVGGAAGLEPGKPSLEGRLRKEVTSPSLGHGFLICTHLSGCDAKVKPLTQAYDARITRNGGVLVKFITPEGN